MSSITPRRKKYWYIMDAIYGMIKLSPICEEFANDQVFKRMNDIKQLGTVYFTHELAIHTRAEHSRGAAHLAKITMERLMSQDAKISEQEAVAVELAALFHDVGHGAYSHAFDSILKESKIVGTLNEHEHRSMILFEYVARKHNIALDQIRRVQYFIDPVKYIKFYTERPQFTEGIDQIVNNTLCGLDVDKMDYLNRDSLFLGLNKIFKPINMISILKNTNLVDGKWTFDACDIEQIMDICSRRYTLYAGVYVSADSVIIAQMLTEAIKAANLAKPFLQCAKLQTDADIDAFCKLTDNYIAETLILNDPDPQMDVARGFMTRIVNKEYLFRITGRFVTMSTEPMFVQSDINTKFVKSKLLTDSSNPDTMMDRIPFKISVSEMNDAISVNRKDIKSMYSIVKTDLLTPGTDKR